MTTTVQSPLSSLWRKWKSVRLPWRRRWLAGVDLNGNQYYYFRPSASLPIRRILQSNPQIPYSDINIPPQWHQWLRQTRPEPPSLQEQQNDLIRQQQLKVLARQADERWAQKASVLDKPRRANQELGVGDGETEGTVGRRWEPGRETAKGEIVEKDRSEAERRERENPWKRDRGAPGEGWQPESWGGNMAARKP